MPTVFAGLDVYNGGTTAATIRLRSPQLREQIYTLKPGELRRLRTDWHDPSSSIQFDFEEEQALLFDNVAYQN